MGTIPKLRRPGISKMDDHGIEPCTSRMRVLVDSEEKIHAKRALYHLS